MGNKASKKTNEQYAYETDGTKLLSAYDLFLMQYDIENLAFGSGGARALAYAGAVKVLDLIGVLRNVKRFAGVGTGALIAALLAIGFDSDGIYKYFNKHLECLVSDEKDGYAYVSRGFYQNFSWNAGTKFLDWFAEILETKSYDSEITFRQLYQVTNMELCILVTNIRKNSTIYCHTKTTPDMPISRAILMSLSLPGIHIPKKYKTEHELCLHGGRVCSYPIHVFDGWWLSMDSENSFLNECCSSISKISAEQFEPKNSKTLGFMFIDNNEENQTALVDRLSSVDANIDIPPTTLGRKHTEAMVHHLSTETEYFILRKACKHLFRLAEEIADDDGLVSEEELATHMFNKDLLGIEFRTKLLPIYVDNEENCASYLISLRDDEAKLYVDSIKDHFEKKAQSVLDKSLVSDNANMGLPGFSSKKAKLYHKKTLNLSKDDHYRTVGILTRYIGINDVNLELEDQHFLYTQGWNATVVLLHRFTNGLKEGACSSSS